MLKVIILLLYSIIAYSQSVEDPRFCGYVDRYENGTIKRSTSELRKFQSIYPCPATGLREGPCEDWSIDHIVSLACGGCDKFYNMQWLPNAIKSCSGSVCKDRWERKIMYNQDVIGINPKGCSPSLIILE